MTPLLFADIAPSPLPSPKPPPSSGLAGAHPSSPSTAAAAASPPTVREVAIPVATAAPTAAPTTTATAPASPAPTSGAEDRSTTFQAVETGTEAHSGSTLMVEAYAVLWVILMGWIVLLWRKQSGLHARLDDLERAIDREAIAAEKATPGRTENGHDAKA